MQIIINTDKFVKALKYLVKPVVMLIAIYAGANAVLFIEKARPSDFGFYKDIFSKELVIKPSKNYPLRRYGDSLTTNDILNARIAWKYFENNYQKETGLFNSVDAYPATTLWDIGSSFHAVMSAYEIGIIDSIEFNNMMTKSLNSMRKMSLYKNTLPNKVYSTYTLDMVDYANHASKEGIGWSAMDIGRFFGVVSRIRKFYPQYTPSVNQVVSKWDINKILHDATLHGIGFNFKDKDVTIVQEGKLGYEEYASKGYIFNDFDATESYKYTDFLKFIEIYGIEIATDTREVKHHPAYNYILSEPYILDGIEYGWDINSKELAYRVYKVQKKRANDIGIPVAVSEGHIDKAPYFVYNSIYTNGDSWICLAENGDDAEVFKSFSTKAAFAWSTLYDDNYSNVLIKNLEGLYNEDKGWYSGRYDTDTSVNKTLTANTNAVILECINYKMRGPLLRNFPKNIK
jgi:hypothetical protein